MRFGSIATLTTSKPIEDNVECDTPNEETDCFNVQVSQVFVRIDEVITNQMDLYLRLLTIQSIYHY